MFIPMIAKMKNISIISDPTLAIEGRITKRLSTSTLKFLDARINLNTLIILMAFKILRKMTIP
jgi:hypothetical protein